MGWVLAEQRRQWAPSLSQGTSPHAPTSDGHSPKLFLLDSGTFKRNPRYIIYQYSIVTAERSSLAESVDNIRTFTLPTYHVSIYMGGRRSKFCHCIDDIHNERVKQIAGDTSSQTMIQIIPKNPNKQHLQHVYHTTHL